MGSQREEILMINEACKLYSEAIEKIVEAKALFKACGIVACQGISDDATLSDKDIGCNVQIYKGINKLSHLTATSLYPDNTNNSEDKSLKMKLGNLYFLQVSPDE